MLTLAAGNKYSPREAGFSLVELLAVLVIISLMAGAVVVTLSPRGQAFELEVTSISQRLDAFLDQGALHGEIRALGPDQTGLGLFIHNGLRWTEAERLTWPSEARVQLLENGRRQDLPEKAVPQYLFEPFGLSDPFEIRLSGARAEFALTNDTLTAANGKLAVAVR